MSDNMFSQNFRQELLAVKAADRDMNEISLAARKLLETSISQGIIELEQVHACVCSSTNLEPLASVDRFGLEFGSLICADCGLVMTNPRIAEKSLPYYYDRIYHPLNYGTQGFDDLQYLFGAGQGQKIFNLVRETLRPDSRLRVLEVGSGTGSVLREFIDEALKSGFNDVSAVGTEFSHECIDVSRARNDGRKIEFVYGGLNEIIEHHSGTFNLIVLSHVFEHFVNLDLELARISSLLEPDGHLYIEVPGIFQTHKARHYNFSFFGYLIHAHVYNFTAASLAKIVCARGFYLQYINENVEAVFRKHRAAEVEGASAPHLSVNVYPDIIPYLKLLARDQQYFLGQAEKEKQMAMLVQQKDGQIKQKDAQIEARGVQMRQKDEQMQNKNIQIQQKNTQIEAKDVQMRQKDAQIQQKDDTIRALSEALAEFNGLFFARAARKISRLLSKWN